MTAPVFKLLYLNQGTGEHGRLPADGIVEIGGVAGNTFTVGGIPVMLADGSSSAGGGGLNLQLSLQNVYDYSTNGTINLTSGKNFTIESLNNKIFQVDAATGRVTISGDLTVLGSGIIEGTLANVDQISITPPNSSTSGLLIEPANGVTMATDLVRVRAQKSGPSVFTIDLSGNTLLKQLTVSGTINGINLNNFFDSFQAHINGIGIKHRATEISVDDTNFQNIYGTNVQQALDSIDEVITNVSTGGEVALVRTHEHQQDSAQVAWYITHAKNSRRPTVTIYDEDNVMTFADEVKVIDQNTVRVAFSTPQRGRAIILLF